MIIIKIKTALILGILCFLNLPVQLFAGNGNHIPSKGTIRTLILFVQFDDDSLTKSNSWTYDTLSLPSWCNNFIDTSIAQSGENNNLTQYFYEMSHGDFQLIGNVYPDLIRPDYDEINYRNIGEVNSEILNRLDELVDYSKYDGWSQNINGDYINEPDGIVDLIFIIYRNFSNRLFNNNSWTGSAELYLTKDIMTNDSVLIKKGRMKSGIQLRGGIHGFGYTTYTAAHELGHFMFGAGHIEGITNLGLMTGGPVWNASRGMHSFEREKLGWIQFTEVSKACDSTYNLADYMTTGQALKLILSEKEYFIFENRQRISAHDYAGDKGIYIYHVEESSFSPKITVETADGFWDFKIDTINEGLYKKKQNPLGKSELNFRKRQNSKTYSCYDQVYGNNSAWGDTADAFDINYNNVFSPVSNPPSLNKTKIGFTAEIAAGNKGTFDIQFYFEDPFAGHPSKPQNFNLWIDSSAAVKLSWQKNAEPDIYKYNIYMQTNADKFTLIDSIADDNQQTIISRSGREKLDKSKTFHYAVTAVDLNYNESVKTDICELKWSDNNKSWIIKNYAFE